jgi:hypothetical protein
VRVLTKIVRIMQRGFPDRENRQLPARRLSLVRDSRTRNAKRRRVRDEFAPKPPPSHHSSHVSSHAFRVPASRRLVETSSSPATCEQGRATPRAIASSPKLPSFFFVYPPLSTVRESSRARARQGSTAWTGINLQLKLRCVLSPRRLKARAVSRPEYRKNKRSTPALITRSSNNEPKRETSLPFPPSLPPPPAASLPHRA